MDERLKSRSSIKEEIEEKDMRYQITGINTKENITIHEESEEIKDAEEKFIIACFKCNRVVLYDKIKCKKLMNF